MLWDRDDLNRYERWLESQAGRFAISQELKLFERLTSAWPRRGRSVLDIGCGPGVFLNFFHQAGFDVTGLDKSPVMLAAARERLGCKAELRLGEASHLPFDDNSFDYAVLFTVLEFVPEPLEVLKEAARVAKHAVLVSYLNRLSLYSLAPRGRGGPLSMAAWFFPWTMRSLMRQAVGPAPIREASVLPGPPFTWRPGLVSGTLNGFVLPLPLGGYCALSADLSTQPVLTPLPAWPAGAQPSNTI